MKTVRDALTTPVSESTLERFREAAASGHPTPAGVAVAAVSAGFAFGLLAKALAVSARKSMQPVDLAKLEPAAAAARAESSRMLQIAADDIAAFKAYMAAARLPQATDRERLERRRALDAAVRRAIEVPLAGAHSASAGLQLCVEAIPMTRLVVLADLAAAATLLASALRVFVVCAESNIRQLAQEASPYRELLTKEANGHERALLQAQEVFEHVAAALKAAGSS